ncbi:MAG: AMP-binding protein [Pseudomonadota bacterium]
MNKFWLESYPPDVPAEIDPGQYRSLVHLLENAFTEFSQRTAYVCKDDSLTYQQIDLWSRDLAAWLQARALKKGARVAVMLPNLLQFPIATAAILRAGCIVVNINPLYTPRELEHQLNDCGAEVIIVLSHYAPTLEQVAARTALRHVVFIGLQERIGIDAAEAEIAAPSPLHATSFNRALSEGAGLTMQEVELAHEDVAFLQYTGGTTGVSKGAMLTHRNMLAAVLQSEAWLLPAFERAPRIDSPVFVCALPLYHIFALTGCCLLSTKIGGTNILITNPRDMPAFVAELARHKFNVLPGVNTMYNGLMNTPSFAELDFSSLRLCNAGGTAVQLAIAQRWHKMTGTLIVEGYGLSETSPGATANPVDTMEFSGTIGLPIPSTEIAILDDQGLPVPVGQAGEIAIRGPQLMAGYWGRPDETEKAMTADGFFKSGDIGIIDARGYVRIIDRKKDMILVSGFNVYPNEIEGVVATLPGVLECACVGVADEVSGEAVKLFVVRRDPALSAQQIREYCREQLTAYKNPKHIAFLDELPKTPVGKILRRELRDKKEPA